MAFNLVSLISKVITPDIIARIADALGIERSKAHAAIAAAVPAVLAGLASSAAQPGGALRIAVAVNQNSDVLDSVTAPLGGGNQASLVGRGSQLMSSLFSARDSSALGEAVGRYANISEMQSSSLLGILTPLVMGGIGQAIGPRPDAGAIASLLAGQKDNIKSALPAEIGYLLSGTGLLGAFSGAARTAQAAGARTGTMANDGMRAAASTAHSFDDRGLDVFDNRLYWLLPLLALTALAVWLVAGNVPRDNINRASAVPTIMLGNDNVGVQLADGIGSLNRVLAGVTDAESARAALPRLRMISEQLDSAKDRLAELTDEERRKLARAVDPALPVVDQAMHGALTRSGVADELRPTLDELRTKLSAFSS